jgi:hypothetical protein
LDPSGPQALAEQDTEKLEDTFAKERKMNSVRRVLFTTAARALFLTQFAGAQGGEVSAPNSVIPRVVQGASGPNAVASNVYNFSWQEFFALNWPAKMAAANLPERGVADSEKTMGDVDVPRVWETWKADYELFPVQTAKVVTPSPWNSWDVPVSVCTTGARLLPFIAKGQSLIPSAVNQAMGGPLVDRHGRYVRYEVRVNQAIYEKVVAESWYLRTNLSEDPQKPNLLPASTATTYGAIEVKAAWRVMTDSEVRAVPRRYYMTDVHMVDPKTGRCSSAIVKVGLIGFHIAHKTEPFNAWVWSTFEQVDNVPADGSPPPALGYSLFDGKDKSDSLRKWGYAPRKANHDASQPVAAGKLHKEPAKPVHAIRLNPIPEDIMRVNDQVHQLAGIKGTVWENYELVGAQWQQAFPSIRVSNPNKNDDLYGQLNAQPRDAVANTTMETFYQGEVSDKARNARSLPNLGTSCMHCHYQAAQWDFSWMLADQAWPQRR